MIDEEPFNIFTYVYAHLSYSHMYDINSPQVIDLQSVVQHEDYRLEQNHRMMSDQT